MIPDTLPELPVKCLHTFEHHGQHFAFNGESLLLAQVSGDVSVAVALAAECDRQRLEREIGRRLGEARAEAALNALAAMAAAGFFTVRATEDALRALDAERVERSLKEEPLPCLLQLAVTSVCNLRCTYCYADFGAFAAPKRQGQYMTPGTVRGAMRLLAKTRHDPVRVALLGGEPLLHPEFQGFLDAIADEIARIGKTVIIQLDTNGTCVPNSALKALRKHDVRVSVSLDGLADVQDAHRPFADGRPSYSIVSANVGRLVGALGAEKVNINITCTPCSVDAVLDFREKARAMFGGVTVKITPAWVTTNHPFAWGPDSVESWGECSRGLAALQAGEIPDADVESKAIREHTVNGRRIRLAVCAFSSTQLAISVDGAVYPCIPLIGRPEYLMGRVDDGELVRPPKVMELIRTNSVLRREKCRDCWAKYTCAGGCPVVNLIAGGDCDHCPDTVCGLLQYYTEADLISFITLSDRTSGTEFKMAAC